MEIVSLFPSPLFISDEYPTSPSEQAILRNQVWRQNSGGNKTSANSYVLDVPELGNVKAFLQMQIELFAHQVLGIRRDTVFYMTQSWVNLNEKGTQHYLHAHQNSLISGVYFLDGDAAPIVFRRAPSHELFGNIKLEIDQVNQMNASDYSFVNRRNRAMLFPSTTPHFVGPNLSDVPRISIAFNSFAKGQLGAENDLTKLDL